MPKYHITITERQVFKYEVWADSEREALEMVNDDEVEPNEMFGIDSLVDVVEVEA